MGDKMLYYLHELSDYKVASDYPDVRGWSVTGKEGTAVGKVDNLIVNKKTKRVVYLDVEVDKSIIEENHEVLQSKASEGVHEFINKEGENHLIIPIGLVDLDEDNKQVKSNEISTTTFSNARRFNKGSDINRDYEVVILQQFRPVGNTGNNQDIEDDNFYNQQEFQSRRL